MKRIIIMGFLVVLFSPFNELSAQTDSTKNWTNSGEISINFSQLSLTNWNAGGQSSVALNGLLKYRVIYDKDKNHWENLLETGYGFIQRKGENTIKSDDKIELTSEYNRRISKIWNYSGLLGFKTQYTDGFNYPNDSVAISKFLAPAYLTYSIGMSYKPSSKFSLLISPATGKTTFVNDDVLSAAGAFGVEKGKKIRTEIGALLKNKLNLVLMKNITFESKLVLFSNYLNNPQNIDVNWQAVLTMNVNSWISVSVNTELIYDDDIDIAIDNNDDGTPDEFGPRIQFKELLGVGVTYKF